MAEFVGPGSAKTRLAAPAASLPEGIGHMPPAQAEANY